MQVYTHTHTHAHPLANTFTRTTQRSHKGTSIRACDTNKAFPVYLLHGVCMYACVPARMHVCVCVCVRLHRGWTCSRSSKRVEDTEEGTTGPCGIVSKERTPPGNLRIHFTDNMLHTHTHTHNLCLLWMLFSPRHNDGVFSQGTHVHTRTLTSQRHHCHHETAIKNRTEHKKKGVCVRLMCACVHDAGGHCGGVTVWSAWVGVWWTGSPPKKMGGKRRGGREGARGEQGREDRVEKAETGWLMGLVGVGVLLGMRTSRSCCWNGSSSWRIKGAELLLLLLLSHVVVVVVVDDGDVDEEWTP